ncbi:MULTISPECIES: zinc-ribbon domain-containing protein [Haloferax]|uniref:Zinc-ribbon domain-containing protein n=2 Tax=Haloferax TaxID=2251 RepID=A0A6G1Z0K2_9EURY|nr:MULTISPECIES: zinc ribbon domain-containing protein [Haloferax]KAB1187395.1 zinc ribbon domain-containing protein [Haloferax sp. CBA1149]MRW80043.1 zinc-ribbon domain-containing protein [Haloferax marinisediminis]
MSPVSVLQAIQTNSLLLVVVAVPILALLWYTYQFTFYRSLATDGESGLHESKTNCPNCGARVSQSADRCEYCGHAVVERP